MSTAIDSVFPPYCLGHHSMLEAMSRPLNDRRQEPVFAGTGDYSVPEQYVSQPSRLPGMASLFPTPNQQLHGYHGYANTGYSSGYPVPFPAGQTPPQLLPADSKESQPTVRHAADVHRSPARLSIASDRSDQYQGILMARQDSVDCGHVNMPIPYSAQGRSGWDTVVQGSPPSGAVGKLIPAYAGPRGASPPPSGPQPSRSPLSPNAGTSSRQENISMSIANLLSAEPAGQHTATRRMRSPPRPARAGWRITVRQQPFAARSCGFGERDRRVIDPPPIVQLTIHDPNAAPQEITQRYKQQMVMHCSIWDETGRKDMSCMPDEFRLQRRLMGQLVATAFVGRDENDEEGCFFVFPDLSCRTPGTFRLKFTFVPLDTTSMHRKPKCPIEGTVLSEPFQVFNAKDFPGMRASTALTKKLREQGCLISIKKGNEKGHGRNDSLDSDDDGEDTEPKSKGRKRQKKDS